MAGEAISLVCADEVDMLRAIETLTRQAIPRYEEPGFEADHRVPETAARGAATPARKGPAPNAAKATKRPAGAPPLAKAPAADRKAARPAGGSEALGVYTPPEKPAKSAPRERAPAKETFAPRRASAPGGGSRGPAAPKGAVVVTNGRGAKSQARTEGRAAAKPAGRKSRSGPR
jgi:hypothetical protein